MRKKALLAGLAMLVAALVFALSSRPPLTLTLRGFTNDPRVAGLYEGSNYQALVAIIELRNNSKRDLKYTAYWPCPSLPYFRCVYRKAGAWQEDPFDDTATTRATIECPAAITGQPWGPWLLRPGEKLTFKADILRPRTECRIVVDYSEKKTRKTWRDRLPQWIAKRLPARKDELEAWTEPIANGSKR